MSNAESLNYGRHILDDFAASHTVNKVIDLGGGLGGDLAIIKRHQPQAELHAIESNIHYANHLRSLQINVHQLNLERSLYPFENESVDLIIANQIFEHVKDIFWVLHEASRILKQGGIFYVGVPNLAALHNRLLLLLGRQPSCIQNHSAHVRGFTRHDMVNLLNKAWPSGYKLISYKGSNFYPFPPYIAKHLANIFPSLAVTSFFVLSKSSPYQQQYIDYPVDLETNFYLGNKIHHEV